MRRKIDASERQDLTCPYYPDGRQSSLEYVVLKRNVAERFDVLLAKGYRRFGEIYYRTACRGCDACVPIRLEVAEFTPSKSQRRTLRRNEDIRVTVQAPGVTSTKIALYDRYRTIKHGWRDAAEELDLMTWLYLTHYGYVRTLEMDYYLGDRLVGVGIVDETTDALSSNYFYYDTDLLPRRLGVYSIVNEISLARLMRKKYYYLGFYIEELPKMSYKKFFRPNELYRNGQWSPFLGP